MRASGIELTSLSNTPYLIIRNTNNLFLYAPVLLIHLRFNSNQDHLVLGLTDLPLD